jgi:hypothetical protein
VEYLAREPAYGDDEHLGDRLTSTNTPLVRTLGWSSRELFRELELDPKVPASIRCPICTVSASLAEEETRHKGDPPGPCIIPVTSSIFSSLVTTRMPSGGFFLSSASSRINLRVTAGDTDCQTSDCEHNKTNTEMNLLTIISVVGRSKNK